MELLIIDVIPWISAQSHFFASRFESQLFSSLPLSNKKHFCSFIVTENYTHSCFDHVTKLTGGGASTFSFFFNTFLCESTRNFILKGKSSVQFFIIFFVLAVHTFHVLLFDNIPKPFKSLFFTKIKYNLIEPSLKIKNESNFFSPFAATRGKFLFNNPRDANICNLTIFTFDCCLVT